MTCRHSRSCRVQFRFYRGLNWATTSRRGAVLCHTALQVRSWPDLRTPRQIPRVSTARVTDGRSTLYAMQPAQKRLQDCRRAVWFNDRVQPPRPSRDAKQTEPDHGSRSTATPVVRRRYAPPLLLLASGQASPQAPTRLAVQRDHPESSSPDQVDQVARPSCRSASRATPESREEA